MLLIGMARDAIAELGSLRLPCTTLSFATPCRFIPALSRVGLSLRQLAEGQIDFYLRHKLRERGQESGNDVNVSGFPVH